MARQTEPNFFAVSVETFFELPRELKHMHPELFRLLEKLFPLGSNAMAVCLSWCCKVHVLVSFSSRPVLLNVHDDKKKKKHL